MKFKSDIELQAGLRDGSNDIGTSGQILSSTGSQTNWIDQSSIVASEAKLVVIECKNTSGSAISKGTPVYQTGTVGATDVIEIDAADASDEDKMAAIGLLQTDLANNAFGKVVITGELLNITTSPIDGVTPVTGDTIYVKSGGGLTLTKPTGVNFIQNIGLVGKVSGGNSGSITVSSIMRSNDVPTPLYIDHTNQRLGIGVTPSQPLDVNGTALIRNTVYVGDNIQHWGDGGTGLYFGTDTLSLQNNGGNTRLYIQSGGNVGIGTTSPGAKLDVRSTASNYVATFKHSTGTGYAPGSILLEAGQGNARGQGIYHYNNVADENWFTGVPYNVDSKKWIVANKYSTTQDVDTAQLNYALLTIDSDTGNVGIGTTSPSTKLQVDSSTAFSLTNGSGDTLLLTNDSTVSAIGAIGPSIGFGNMNNNNRTSAIAAVRTGGDHDNMGLAFFTHPSDSGDETVVQKMTITHEGNVGIGTTSPTAPLDVNGVIRSRGGSYAADVDTKTDVGLVIPENYFIYTADGSSYLRKLIGKTSDIITIGEAGTSLIDGINLVPGTAGGYVQIFNNSSIAAKFVDGKLGIGTTSPRTKLHITGLSGDDDPTLGSSTAPFFVSNTANSYGLNIGVDVNGTSWLQSQSNTSATAYKMSLNPLGGNVGIGTTSPTALLQVTNGSGGDIAIGTNTVAVKTLMFGSNEDYSIQSNGGTYLRFHTEGSERMRITSAGNVGIGTTSPAQPFQVDAGSNIASFRSVGTGENNKELLIQTGGDRVILDAKNADDGTATSLAFELGNSEKARLTTTGLGIGTTSPGQKLQVEGNSWIKGIYYDTSGDAGTSGQVLSSTATGTNWVSGSGLPGGPYLPLSAGSGEILTGDLAMNNNIGIITKDSSGAFRDILKLNSSNVLEIGSSSLNTNIIFKNSGNVGIGTTSPGARLHVNSENSQGTLIISRGGNNLAATNNVGSITFPADYNGTPINYAEIKAYANALSGVRGSLDFNVKSTSGAVLTGMTVYGTSSGVNVGIGTTSPGQKLDVNGNANIDGTLFVNTTNNHIRLVDTDNTGNFSVGVNTNFQIRDITANTTPLTIRAGTPGNTILTTSSGRVGIGLSSPSTTLHVNGFARLNGGLQMNIENAQIYQIQDSSLRFGTNNIERMRITSDGNVGIGTDSPITALEVNGDIGIGRVAGGYTFRETVGGGERASIKSNATNELIFSYGASTEAMRINSSGNVGIGTTSPSTKLQVYSSTVGQYMEVGAGDGGGRSLVFTSSDNNGSAGALHTINAKSINGAIALSTSGNERMRITNTGNVGIGNTAPVNGKLVVTSGVDGPLNTVRIQHTRDDANVSTNALEIDMNLSGADTTTADRTNKGMHVDLDSSADGDASNEHRIHGIGSTVNFTGFSDIVRAGNFYAESGNITEKTAQLVGVYGQAVHDANSVNGGVSNMQGVYGYSDIQDLGDVDNAFGGYFLVNIGESRGNADIGVTKGVEGEIQINKASTINYGTMIGVSSIIDNNEGAVPNFGNQYLFKGDYQGTKGSNAYGIYTEGDKHYFDGKVGIGNTSPDEKLEVSGSGASDYPYIKISNPSQTGRYMRIGMIDSINHCIEANGGSTYLTFKTNATERMRIATDGAIQFNDYGAGTLVTDSSGNITVSSGGGAGGPYLPLSAGSGYPLTGALYLENSNTDVVMSGNTSGNFTIDNNTGNIAFLANGSSVQSMTITSSLITINEPTNFTNGNVGIGTTSPSENLHVRGSVNNDDVAIYIHNAFDDNLATSNPTSALLLGAASNNAYLRLHGAPADTASKHQVDLGSTAGGSFLTFSPGSTERMRIASSGYVGIGYTSPNAKLAVNGDFGIQGQLFTNTGIAAATGSGIANGFAIPYRLGITTLSSNYNYIVRLTTTGTGTDSGSYYLVGYDAGTSSFYTRMVSRGGSNSNHPQLAISGNTMVAYHTHASSYNIRWSCETIGTGDPDGTLHNMGADYQWQRNLNSLYYTDGNVGIGTDSPNARLNVDGGIKIEGTNSLSFGGSGSVPAWAINSSGDDLIIDDQATTSGDVLFNNNGSVGIGTTTPGDKLHVNGTVRSQASATSDWGLLSFNSSGTSSSGVWFNGGSAQLLLRRSDNSLQTKIVSSGNSYINGGSLGLGTTSPNLKLDVISGTNNGIRISATDTTNTWRDIDIRSYVSQAQANALPNGSAIYTTNPTAQTETAFSKYGGLVLQGRDDGNSSFAIRLGNGNGYATRMFMGATGATTFSNTVTATNFILSSDERLKENVEKVCDNRVKADWKTFELKTEKGQKRYGVIAQELEKTNPEFVREDSEGFKSVAYIDLLIAKIAELEARLEKLEK